VSRPGMRTITLINPRRAAPQRAKLLVLQYVQPAGRATVGHFADSFLTPGSLPLLHRFKNLPGWGHGLAPVGIGPGFITKPLTLPQIGPRHGRCNSPKGK